MLQIESSYMNFKKSLRRLLLRLGVIAYLSDHINSYAVKYRPYEAVFLCLKSDSVSKMKSRFEINLEGCVIVGFKGVPLKPYFTHA